MKADQLFCRKHGEISRIQNVPCEQKCVVNKVVCPYLMLRYANGSDFFIGPPVERPAEPSAESLNPEALDALPWSPYKSNNPALRELTWIKNPGHFSQADAPPVLLQLVKAIRNSAVARRMGFRETPVVIVGDYEYGFSGQDKDSKESVDMFVVREPVKHA